LEINSLGSARGGKIGLIRKGKAKGPGNLTKVVRKPPN